MITRNFGDYPDHRLRFFALLHAITNNCFATLLALSPPQLKLLMDSIVWAFRHTERNVAETGLSLLLDLLAQFSASECVLFCPPPPLAGRRRWGGLCGFGFGGRCRSLPRALPSAAPPRSHFQPPPLHSRQHQTPTNRYAAPFYATYFTHLLGELFAVMTGARGTPRCAGGGRGGGF